MKKLISVSLLFLLACAMGFGINLFLAERASACWDCSPQPNDCNGNCVSAPEATYCACAYPGLCCCYDPTPIALYQSTQKCDGVRCWVKVGCTTCPCFID